MTSLLSYSPSDSDIYNACLSFRHDFGLLPKPQQTLLKSEAKWWLIAWGHTLPQFKITPDTPQTPSDAPLTPNPTQKPVGSQESPQKASVTPPRLCPRTSKPECVDFGDLACRGHKRIGCLGSKSYLELHP